MSEVSVILDFWGRTRLLRLGASHTAGRVVFGTARVACLCLILLPCSASRAQEALRSSMAGEAAVALRRAQAENLAYTYKAGDFKLLLSSSLGLEYNDNIGTTEGSRLDDFILRPELGISASYPITRANLLRLNLGLGYDDYLNHSQYSFFRLDSGSALSFDMYIQDFWINFHDRFQSTQDPGAEPGVANGGRYGGFDNTAGASVTWDLEDVVLDLGYDHENFIASKSEFKYLDRASELLLARAGFRVHPTLTTGLEATGSFTAYDQPILNDMSSYSAGLFADWQLGSHFRVQPRVGYTSYFFKQTSRSIRAVDQDTWYAALSVVHGITEALSYSIGAGHELRLGTQADFIEDTYVRSSVMWSFIKDYSLTAELSYETGTQGTPHSAGGVSEDYDWFSGSLGLRHAITRKLMAALNYRYTVRSSNSTSSRGYTQNIVGLLLTYTFQ